MAAKKEKTVDEKFGEHVAEVMENVAMIQYEEQIVSVKEPGKERYRALQKVPYLDYGGHKVYLTKSEAEGIRKGKIDPKKLLDEIRVEEVYKNG